MDAFRREPYRLLFPIGIAYGFWGVAIWLLYGLKLMSTYPGPLHMLAMIGGFLGSFAFGFLATAIPRFTQSVPPTKFELFSIAFPLFAGPFLIVDAPNLFPPALTIAFLAMTVFTSTRWAMTDARPPAPFVLIGYGLASAVSGLVLLQLPGIDPRLVSLGRLLFLRAFMLLIVVGVGSQLIPMLLGHAPPGGCMRPRRTSQNPFLYLGLIFLSSFFVEALLQADIGRCMQAFLVAAIALKHWHIWSLPNARTKLAWVLWLSCWFLVVGLVGEALIPQYAIHFLHLTFIGGLALITLMVATRVVLAHGGFSLVLESRLKSLFWVGGFILFASITRMAAGFIPAAYESHLLYAASLWLIGLAIWSIVLGRKIIFTQTQTTSTGGTNP